MANEKTLKASDLSQFSGTEHWYKHLVPGVVYTDGVKYVAETGGAYWLIDEIATSQLIKRVRAEEFQVWTLKKPNALVAADKSAVLTMADGNLPRAIYKKNIDYTDFPLDEITLWFTGGVIMLPSEY